MTIIPYSNRFYDTNKWHGDITWGSCRDAVPAMVTKAFDACPRMFEDVKFDFNRRRAEEAGLLWGSYLFYWPRGIALAQKQAERYIRTLGKNLGTLTYTNPKGEVQPVLAVDVEMLNTAPKIYLAVPPVSKATRDDLHEVLLHIERLTGIVPVIYSGYSEWKYFFPVPSPNIVPDWADWIDDYYFWWSNPPYMAMPYPVQPSNYSLKEPDWEVYWDTKYLKSSTILSLAPGVSLDRVWAWQFSFKGRIPGVNADCDINWVLK